MNENPNSLPVYYANGFGIAMSHRDIAIALFDAEPDFLGVSKKVDQKHRATLKISQQTGLALVRQLLETFLKEPEMKEHLLKIIRHLDLK